jgi:hypothetical protein
VPLPPGLANGAVSPSGTLTRHRRSVSRHARPALATVGHTLEAVQQEMADLDSADALQNAPDYVVTLDMTSVNPLANSLSSAHLRNAVPEFNTGAKAFLDANRARSNSRGSGLGPVGPGPNRSSFKRVPSAKSVQSAYSAQSAHSSTGAQSRRSSGGSRVSTSAL